MTIITLLLGALITFVLRYMLIGIQENRARHSRRLLIVGLLGDEIEYRWKRYLRRDFVAHAGRGNDFKAARSFATRVMSVKDLPVIDMIYGNTLDSDVFLNRSTMSLLVHAHIILHDICDSHIGIRRLLKRHDKSTDPEEIEWIKGYVVKKWRRVREEVDELDTTLTVLAAVIETGYQEYKRDGGAVLKELDPDIVQRYRSLDYTPKQLH